MKPSIATFSIDITPPLGHPLCGGWIEPVRGISDPLRCLGLLLYGFGEPILLCSLDWVGLRNDAHLAWRKALAEAIHTATTHVAVQTVHQHNAPFADTGAQKLLNLTSSPLPSIDLAWFQQTVKKVSEAAKGMWSTLTPISHFTAGSAIVEQVASNRRVVVDGKVKYTRTSATKSAEARSYPEGLIDPELRTLGFWNGEQCVAELHFYATHPMSYYGDGMVSADFCGLARQQRQEENPKVFQMYFTGCAGNITAGKYNDGAKENRPILMDRIYQAMKKSSDAGQHAGRIPIQSWNWRVEPVRFSARKEASFSETESRKVMEDVTASKASRINAAFQLAWLNRIQKPIDLACLTINSNVSVLFLPGEPFIEYQLAAAKMKPNRSIFVAGYGDDGLGYIPTMSAFSEGGYEPTVALAAIESEEFVTTAIRKLLAD